MRQGGIDGKAMPAGHVVTVWWVIFNNPEFCQFGEPVNPATGFAGTRCGPGDLGIVPGLTPDPRVDPLVTYAARHVTGSNGGTAWASYLSAGAPRGQVLIGTSFTNPLGADVHPGRPRPRRAREPRQHRRRDPLVRLRS